MQALRKVATAGKETIEMKDETMTMPNVAPSSPPPPSPTKLPPPVYAILMRDPEGKPASISDATEDKDKLVETLALFRRSTCQRATGHTWSIVLLVEVETSA